MKDKNLLIQNGVNLQKGLELFGDMETYDETLETFLAEAPGKFVRIKNFKETADMAQYAILVHSLKSDAKYFGFEKLAELAYQHELDSKANNLYAVMDNFEVLETETNRIIKLVKQYLGKEPVVNQAPPVMPQTNVVNNSNSDKTIIVVDDSDIIRNILIKIFNDEYEVLLAGDGQQAINIVNQSLNKNIIGMLLDLNMPNVDGFAVLDYLKQNNLFSKFPVAIITGNDTADTDRKAFEYPIVDMLKKPFNERSVKAIVDKLIYTKQS